MKSNWSSTTSGYRLTCSITFQHKLTVQRLKYAGQARLPARDDDVGYVFEVWEREGEEGELEVREWREGKRERSSGAWMADRRWSLVVTPEVAFDREKECEGMEAHVSEDEREQKIKYLD